MAESVEQAALAAAERDALPAPWGSMLSALEALDRLGDSRYYALRDVFRTQADMIESLQHENAELRDGMLALSNRIEAVTRREGPSIPVSACGNPATHPAHRYLSYSDAGSAVYEVTAVQCPGVE